MAWDDKAPTKEELQAVGAAPVVAKSGNSGSWDTDAPTPDELGVKGIKPVAPAADVSRLEALLRGGAQGATLGFSDELSGAGSAALGALKGKSLDEIKDIYKKSRDESRTANEAAESAHPALYTTGSIGGSLLPAVLSGGLGEAAEGASALSRLGSAAKTGAAIGAVNGLGDSNADLTSGSPSALGSAAGSALGGAALGGITGGALSGVGSVLGEAGAGKLGTAYNMGTEGTDLLSKAGREAVGQEGYGTAAEYVKKLKKLRADTGADVTDLTSSDAPIDAGATIDKLKGLVSQLSDDIPSQSQDKQTLQSLIDRYEQVSPDEAPVDPNELTSTVKQMAGLKSGLSELSSYGNNSLQSGFGNATAKTGAQTVGNALEDAVPTLEDANDTFSSVDKANRMLGVKPGSTDDAATLKLGNLINSLKNNTKAGNSARFKFGNAIDNLGDDSDLADQFQSDALDTAKRVETARQAGSEQFGAGGIVGALKGGSLQAANAAGQAVGSIGQSMVGKSVGGAAKYLSNLGPDSLQTIAKAVSDHGGDVGQKLGNILNEAASRDETGRNALIFTLMQNPVYRQLLQGDSLKTGQNQ